MPHTDRAPRRDASEAREAVLDCAAGIVDRVGHQGLTIRAVAAESGLTAPALYELFGDKAGLMNALVHRVSTSLVERVRALENPGDPLDYVRLVLRELVRFGRETPNRYQLVEALFSFEGEHGLRRPLLELFDDGRIADHEIETIRQSLWTLLHGLISMPAMRPDVAWREDLAERAFEAMLNGLLPGRVGGEAPKED